jgi:hypothetical protein
MANPSGQLDLGGLQAELSSKDPRHAQIHENLAAAINQVALNAGVSATGDIVAPKAPDSVTVSTGGEYLHVSIAHSGPVNRGVRYFTEIGWDTAGNPNFGQPIVKDHGTSRTPEPFFLPAKDGTGNTHHYIVRSYAQNPGGPPSNPTVAQGGPFTMTGTTQLTLLPSNGSGTAPNTGQSAGQGLGRNQARKS